MIINNWHKINKKWRLDRRLEILEKITSFTVLLALVINILCFVGIVRLANKVDEIQASQNVDLRGTMYLSCSEHLKNKKLECL